MFGRREHARLLVRERRECQALVAPKPPGVLVRGHAGLVINKLSSSHTPSCAPCISYMYPSSVRLNLVSSPLVLKKDLQCKLTVQLRINVFNDETNLTRTELDIDPPISGICSTSVIYINGRMLTIYQHRERLLLSKHYRGTSLIRKHPPPRTLQ